MRPITIKIARAISFPKVKVSCMRVAHLTLAQFMNMVSAKTKKTRYQNQNYLSTIWVYDLKVQQEQCFHRKHSFGV